MKQPAFMIDAFRTVFAQDGVALEAQERSLRADPRFHEVSCKADEAALKARRLLTDLMRAEKNVPRAMQAVSAAPFRRN
jgi:hypothetical protein